MPKYDYNIFIIMYTKGLRCIALGKCQQIRVTRIDDGHDTDSEQFTSSGTKRDIRSSKVVHCRF